MVMEVSCSFSHPEIFLAHFFTACGKQSAASGAKSSAINAAEASERVTGRRHSQRATHDFLPNVLWTACVCAQAPAKAGWTAESGRNTVGKQNLAGLAESGRISRIWPD